ncbi:transcription initiation factor Spt4 [Heterostelium album PN500]|uniref:Transcription initiation factor Spt4 n=1 Tax=Heterostelium pallidum (strain ATCC 26659 / Pp 5 / PN500) TaxID=670386 RepID=D3BNN0_HETP5|nr:transcription initiation factor Spt4 [Heterostelium album PN500]EFA76981.1 transcription initiation factor Spt4 [Heterostelium album PN500]|eukprot:XP_020429112.1 transcription initiation factor Spt4 [Heterostelium album PN500]
MSSRKTIAPTNFKSAKACTGCGLVKTQQQFDENGCENCGGGRRRASTTTTPNFEGVIAVLKPNESWIARKQGLDSRVPGCYALNMTDK